MSTSKRAQAQVTTEDGWTCTVTHADTQRSMHGTPMRNLWHWEIRSTTDAAEWMPVRQWSGVDLSTAVDVNNPDPIGALVSLGSFLSAYVEAVEHEMRTGVRSENADLFPGLDVEAAESVADEIMLDFPDPDGQCVHGYNDGGPCPTCDHCGRSQCSTEGMDWNGETGCHVECEVTA